MSGDAKFVIAVIAILFSMQLADWLLVYLSTRRVLRQIEKILGRRP